MRKPTIIIADDHTLILEVLRKLLEPEYEVVATVEDGRKLIEAAVEHKPDVILLDVGMPLLNGLTAGQRLKQQLRSVKLVYITMNDDPDLAAEALRTGGSGYLLKSSTASELFAALRKVLRGGTYVTEKIKKGMEESFIRSVRPKTADKKLTPRQIEVTQLLSEGKSMKEVAAVLDLTARTVAFHKYRVMERVNVRSNAELVQFAIKNSLVSPRFPLPASLRTGVIGNVVANAADGWRCMPSGAALRKEAVLGHPAGN